MALDTEGGVRHNSALPDVTRFAHGMRSIGRRVVGASPIVEGTPGAHMLGNDIA